jgi:hypothetical protein
MSRDAAVLLAMVLVGAAWLLLHLVLFARIVRARRVAVWLRPLALLPPLTPVAGFMSALWLSSSLWILLCAAYLVLWRLA